VHGRVPHAGANASARVVLVDFRTSREKAERAAELAAAVTQRAAVVLTRDVHVSLRDAAELLGLSHQRIAQVLDETAQGRTRRSRRRLT
jgi:hypothetical protein